MNAVDSTLVGTAHITRADLPDARRNGGQTSGPFGPRDAEIVAPRAESDRRFR